MSYSQDIFNYDRVPTLFALSYFAIIKNNEPLRQKLDNPELIDDINTFAVDLLSNDFKLDDVLKSFSDSSYASAPYRKNSHYALKDRVVLLSLFELREKMRKTNAEGEKILTNPELRHALDSEFLYFSRSLKRKGSLACEDYTALFLEHLIMTGKTELFKRVCDAFYFLPGTRHTELAFKEGNPEIADFSERRSFGPLREMDELDYVQGLCELAIANGQSHMFSFVEKMEGVGKSAQFLKKLLNLASVSGEDETIRFLIKHINGLMKSNAGKPGWNELHQLVQEVSNILSESDQNNVQENIVLNNLLVEFNIQPSDSDYLKTFNDNLEKLFPRQQEIVLSLSDREKILQLFFKTNEWKALQSWMRHKEARLSDILSKKNHASQREQLKRIYDFLGDTLYQAVRISSLETVRLCLFLLTSNKKETAKFMKGVSHKCLELACQYGKRDIVQYFLKFISWLMMLDRQYITYLLIAIKEGYPEIIEDLLQWRDRDKERILSTLLATAAMSGQLKVVKSFTEEKEGRLTEAFASILQPGGEKKDHISLLDAAISGGNVESYDYFATKGVKSKLRFHEQLALAVKAESLALIKRLLEEESNKMKKGDINALINVDNKTALALAVENGNLEIVELLVNNGADPTIAPPEKPTDIIEKTDAPFVLAASLENPEILRFLFSKIKIQRSTRNLLVGAFQTAITHNRLPHLYELLKLFDYKQETERGRILQTNLMYLMENLGVAADCTSDLSIFQFFVNLGAKLDSEKSDLLQRVIVGFDGEENPQRELRKAVILAYLLSRGALIDSKDHHGNTPLKKAIAMKDYIDHRLIIELLLQAGASLAELPSDYKRDDPETSEVGSFARAILKKFSVQMNGDLEIATEEKPAKMARHN